MKRLVRVLLVAVFFAMWVMVAFFALAGIQTADYCVKNGLPIPWQAWAMIAVSAAWCVISVNIPKETLKDLDRFFTKLTEE